MGSVFSKGQFPSFLIGILRGSNLVYLRSRFISTRPKNKGVWFLSIRDVRKALNLTEVQTYLTFNLLDRNKTGKINYLEFWGAFALSTTDPPEDKIHFCFEIMDSNHDGYLSQPELSILIECITRGLANMKGIKPPPLEKITNVFGPSLLYSIEETNEKGEISIKNFKLFVITDGSCRTYLSGLGTVVFSVDQTQLISQRTDILKQIAKIDSEIEKLARVVHFNEEDISSFQRERGGDFNLIALTEDDNSLVRASTDLQDLEASHSRPLMHASVNLKEELSEEQRTRRMNRRMQSHQGKSKTYEIKDAKAFSDLKAGNLKATLESQSSSHMLQGLQYAWNKCVLTSNDKYQDKLLGLDLDLLEDVFEAEGILMADNTAIACISSLSPNQIGRHRLEEVVNWFVSTSKQVIAQNDWELWIQEIIMIFRSWRDAYAKSLKTLHVHNLVIDALSRTEPAIGQILKAAGMHPLVGTAELPNWQRQKILSPPSSIEVQCVFGGLSFSKNILSKPANPPPTNAKVKPSGFSRETASAKPKTSTIKAGSKPFKTTFQIQFFMRPLVEASALSSGINAKKLSKKTKKKTKETKKIPDFTPLNIEPSILFGLFPRTNPDLPSQPTEEDFEKFPELMYQSVSWICIKLKPDLSEAQASCLRATALNSLRGIPNAHPNPIFDKIEAHIFSRIDEEMNNQSPSVTTGTVSSSSSFTSPLPTSLVPQDPPSVKDVPSATSIKFILTPPKQRWFLLIAFLKEKDAFREFESALPQGLLISRSLRKLDLEIKIHQDLKEVYNHSLKFEDYHEKLFGPQEEEIGDEGMNPLRFAKQCRQIKKELLELSERCNLIPSSAPLSRDSLQEETRRRGLSTEGTEKDLKLRLKKYIEREISLVGFGEFSHFGKEAIQRIYHLAKGLPYFPPDPTIATQSGKRPKTPTIFEFQQQETQRIIEQSAGLNLWEFNELLYRLGLETLFDPQEFSALLSHHNLLTKRDDATGLLCLTREGLREYYNQFGRLGSDLSHLGIGSLDDILSGNLSFHADFEADAISSLLNFMERQSGFYPYIKRLIVALSSLRNMDLDVQCPHISDLIQTFVRGDNTNSTEGEDLPDTSSSRFNQGNNISMEERVYDEDSQYWNNILTTLKIPGWIASFIHQWVESFADGELGIIRTLKLAVRDKFGKYHDCEQVFEELIDTWAQQVAEIEAKTQEAKSKLEHEIEMDKLEKEKQAQSENLDPIGPPLELDIEPITHPATKKITFASIETAKTALLSQSSNAFAHSLQSALPPFVDVKKIQEEIDKTHNKIKFLASILESEENSTGGNVYAPNLRLTSGELQSIKSIIERSQLKLGTLQKNLEEARLLWEAHCSSFYDSLRLYAESICSIGCGTLELCFRANLKGINIFEFFPPARGENAFAKDRKKQKLQRSISRKSAALAALKRERLRRAQGNMKSEADQAQAKKRAAEEQQLMLEVQDSLQLVRTRKSIQYEEILSLIHQWESFALLLSHRYPHSLRAFVCLNAVACLIAEFLGISNPKHDDARRMLETATKHCIRLIFESEIANNLPPQEEASKQSDDKSIEHENASMSLDDNASIDTGKQPKEKRIIDPLGMDLEELNDPQVVLVTEFLTEQQKQIFIIIFCNYLHCLRSLSDYNLTGLALMTSKMFDSLPTKIQENLRRGKPVSSDELTVSVYTPNSDGSGSRPTNKPNLKEVLEWIKEEARKEQDVRRQLELDQLHADTDSEDDETEDGSHVGGAGVHKNPSTTAKLEDQLSSSQSLSSSSSTVNDSKPLLYSFEPPTSANQSTGQFTPDPDSSTSHIHHHHQQILTKAPKREKRLSEREKERRAARELRMETSRKRKELYELIQTNEITQLFAEKAQTNRINYDEDDHVGGGGGEG